MHTALNVKLASLPDDTRVACGHDYTASNVAFSLKIDPTNEAMLRLQKWCKVRLFPFEMSRSNSVISFI
jgi:glyoxylase-like metal-dependent hydrolase (beta-lactamase superfamily II)